jgi:hypothetical protein
MTVYKKFTEYTEVFADAAVDIDVTPESEFELVDVVFICETAPTTSENLTIQTETKDGVTIDEIYDEDPSIEGAAGRKCFVYRFDKWFPVGTIIKVDYANTSDHADDITVVVRYIEERFPYGSANVAG